MSFLDPFNFSLTESVLDGIFMESFVDLWLLLHLLYNVRGLRAGPLAFQILQLLLPKDVHDADA